MTTTDKEKAALAREIAKTLREKFSHNAAAADLEAHADRLDPPAPTGKTVTWQGDTYQLTAEGDVALTFSGRPNGVMTPRDYIDAVVLSLLADVPDGPIPDETVEAACAAYEGYERVTIVAMRAALEAVRGLPGMAVVRAGTPPEVLAWGAMHLGQHGGTVQMLSRTAAVEYVAKAPVHRRVVAIIADPGEGTA